MMGMWLAECGHQYRSPLKFVTCYMLTLGPNVCSFERELSIQEIILSVVGSKGAIICPSINLKVGVMQVVRS